MDETTKFKLVEAMRKYGGSFVQALGEALQRADPINTQKILDTWPEYIEQYAKYAGVKGD